MVTHFSTLPADQGATTFLGARRPSAAIGDFIHDAPYWVGLMVRELHETACTGFEAGSFLSLVEKAISRKPDFRMVETRFMLSRINSADCSIRAALVELRGERDSYTLAFQQLTYALQMRLHNRVSAKEQISCALANLKKEAPDVDRAVMLTGAPLSYILMTLSGVWTAALREARQDDNRSTAWVDARNAAREDLVAELQYVSDNVKPA